MIESIKKYLPVPSKPRHTDPASLEPVVKGLGTELPADFIEYCGLYGTGSICVRDKYRWQIISAFAQYFLTFAQDFYEQQSSCREAWKSWESTQQVDLALYPEEGGLLPFGGIDSHYFAWRTNGHPDDWTVVNFAIFDEDGYEDYNMNFTQFIAGLISAKLKIGGFVVDWNPKTDIYFEVE